jgi:CRISPR-associated protein Csx17
MAGLACVDFGRRDAPGDTADGSRAATAYLFLKPFFTPESILRYLGWLPPDRTLPLPAEMAARLTANDTTTALRLAWFRYRALGMKLPGNKAPMHFGCDGQRLLAALMIPIRASETRRILNWLPRSSEAPSDIPHTLPAETIL